MPSRYSTYRCERCRHDKKRCNGLGSEDNMEICTRCEAREKDCGGRTRLQENSQSRLISNDGCAAQQKIEKPSELTAPLECITCRQRDFPIWHCWDAQWYCTPCYDRGKLGCDIHVEKPASSPRLAEKAPSQRGAGGAEAVHRGSEVKSMVQSPEAELESEQADIVGDEFADGIREGNWIARPSSGGTANMVTLKTEQEDCGSSHSKCTHDPKVLLLACVGEISSLSRLGEDVTSFQNRDGTEHTVVDQVEITRTRPFGADNDGDRSANVEHKPGREQFHESCPQTRVSGAIERGGSEQKRVLTVAELLN